MEVNEEHRIIGFEEKPKSPKPMPTNPEMAYSFNGKLYLQCGHIDSIA